VAAWAGRKVHETTITANTKLTDLLGSEPIFMVAIPFRNERISEVTQSQQNI
jgi:hypothetical protein